MFLFALKWKCGVCGELTSEFSVGFELNHQPSVLSDVDPDDLQSG